MPKRNAPEETTNTAGQKRRSAMVEAAYSLFTEKGYASVSVDEIIRVSRGSKSSLYKYFGSKEGILKAVVESLAEQMLREIRFEFHSGRTPRESLRRIGMVLIDLALSDKAIHQYRHSVSHAKAFPDVAKLWFESGPQTTLDGIAAYLEKETAAGRLRVDDPARAARLFGGMILFYDNMRRSVGLPPLKGPEQRRMVSEAVEIFLAAYGT